jgi:sugar phosphate isomerase/epimerase
MNEMTTFRWSFEEDVCEFSKAGYEGIGVWRSKLSDYGEEQGIRLLLEYRLRVSNLMWAGGFTGIDGRSLRESIADAADAIRLACCMDAECLVVYTGARGGHTATHAARLVRTALDELVPYAESAQVTLALEPMHERCAEGWTFLNKLEPTLKLLDEFASDRLKLVYDTYHLALEPFDLADLTRLAQRIAVVHLGDGKAVPRGEQNRCLLGEGIVPVREIVNGLRGAGFNGFFDVELLGEDVEQIAYVDILEHSQRVIREMASDGNPIS